jgi:multidrug efflux pump
MKLSDICIERPVFATVLSLALIVLGLVGYYYLEIRYFPKVDEPIASVSVSYPGASPEVMEQDVTRYLENALVNVDGLQNMTSDSTYNSATVNLTFLPNTNLIKALGDVRNAVSSVQNELPADAYEPNITSGGVARPVLNVGFIDDHLTPAQIRDYVTQEVQPMMQHLPGMGGVWIYGADQYAMRIWLIPQKMTGLGVTVSDVSEVLESNNIDFSGGSIHGASRNYSLVADTRLHSVSEFANLVVKQSNGQIVRLKDIATVELGSQSLQDSPMRINGKSGIDMELRPLDSANPIDVSTEAKQALRDVQKRLPPGMNMVVTYDQSEFLKSAINESFKTLVEAIALVMLVVYLFLGNLRAAMVPIVTIPVCCVAVFGVMLVCGFTINVMTLLGIILAIGLVVDDAIVVLENIHRHIEDGESPMSAALKGSREIGFSVIAMTLTLAAVYAPIGFTSGFTAQVFREFAFTLAGAVLISGFVALTLSPMMCSRVLRPETEESTLERRVSYVLDGFTQWYRKVLNAAIVRRWWVIACLLVVAVMGYGIYLFMPQSFVPKEDVGYFTVGVNGPPGASIPYSDAYMKKLEKVYETYPEILSYAAFIFSGSATNFITMQPWDKRTLSTEQVIDQLREKINHIPGALVTFNVPDPVSYGTDTNGSDLDVHIMTFGSYQDLQKTMDKLKSALQEYPGTIEVDTNLKYDNEVYQLQFKRNEAALLAVNLQDIADTISTMFSGKHVTDFQQNDQAYEVREQMKLKELSSFDSLNNVYVRSSNVDPVTGVGRMIPLSNLVTLSSGVRQSHLYHSDRMRSADLTANLAPGYNLGAVVTHLQELLNSTLTSEEHFSYGGRIQAFLESNNTMLGLFGLSLIFIYLVLAAQFESFVDPFIILLAVPLCIVGALGTLKVTGGSLNLYTNIGLITLVGLITKHGILITQFANTRLREGDALLDAVINAAVVRVRPILMTTLAMVLGAVPLALATGPGSISHSQIGWVIVGGMIFGTFFSLIVVPISYYMLARFDHKKKLMLQVTR